MSRRCSRCGISWPNFIEYRRCPGCGEDTDLIASEKPMSLTEASRVKNELRFARFYEEREAGRTGPSPEELGRAEARTLIELDRRLGNVDGCPDGKQTDGLP